MPPKESGLLLQHQDAFEIGNNHKPYIYNTVVKQT